MTIAKTSSGLEISGNRYESSYSGPDVGSVTVTANRIIVELTTNVNGVVMFDPSSSGNVQINIDGNVGSIINNGMPDNTVTVTGNVASGVTLHDVRFGNYNFQNITAELNVTGDSDIALTAAAVDGGNLTANGLFAQIQKVIDTINIGGTDVHLTVADGEGATFTLSQEIVDGFINTGAGDSTVLVEHGARGASVDGGAGIDTLILGDGSGYTLALSPDGANISQHDAGINVFTNFEQFKVGDSIVSADLMGITTLSGADLETFIELYIAYFNRAPDAVGLYFWGSAFANGTTLSEIASMFLNQDETRATYPSSLGNADFATAVYANVLGRVADQAGFDFWVGVLETGARSRDQFILSVLEGAKATPPAGATSEFVAQQQADQEYLNTKIDIGTYFAAIKGMSSAVDATEVMSLFDGTEASLTAAVAAIDAHHDATADDFLMPLIGVIDDPFAIA